MQIRPIIPPTAREVERASRRIAFAKATRDNEYLASGDFEDSDYYQVDPEQYAEANWREFIWMAEAALGHSTI